VFIMEWPPKSPDLNPTENLWSGVKKAGAASKPTSIGSLWGVIKESWTQIFIKRCKNLVDPMPIRCADVISNKGYTTKY